MNLWIELKDLAQLDSAFCGKKLRPRLLSLFMSKECVIGTRLQSSAHSILEWLIKRNIKIELFFVSRNVDEKLGVQYMKMHGSRVTSIEQEQNRGACCQISTGIGNEIVSQACYYGNLTCVECCNISVPLLNEILLRCPFLQKLDFDMYREVQDNVISNIQKPHLRDLRASASSKIVLCIISLCPHLQKLDLNGLMSKFTDSDLLTITAKCRHLKSLALRRVICNPHTFEEFSKQCTGIEVLNVVNTGVTDDVFVINLKQLRRLHLQFSRELTNKTIQSIVDHCSSTLKELWPLFNSGITSYAVLQLKHHLPAVSVHYPAIYREISTLTANDYAVCTSLIVLYKGFHELAPIVARCKLLQALSVLFAGEVTPQSVNTAVMAEIISCCPHLRTIAVHDKEVSVVKSALTSLNSDIVAIRYDCQKSRIANLMEFSL